MPGTGRPLLRRLRFGLAVDRPGLRTIGLTEPLGAGGHQTSGMRHRLALPSFQGIAPSALDALLSLPAIVLEGVRTPDLPQLLDHELAAAALCPSERLEVQQ